VKIIVWLPFVSIDCDGQDLKSGIRKPNSDSLSGHIIIYAFTNGVYEGGDVRIKANVLNSKCTH